MIVDYNGDSYTLQWNKKKAWNKIIFYYHLDITVVFVAVQFVAMYYMLITQDIQHPHTFKFQETHTKVWSE